MFFIIYLPAASCSALPCPDRHNNILPLLHSLSLGGSKLLEFPEGKQKPPSMNLMFCRILASLCSCKGTGMKYTDVAGPCSACEWKLIVEALARSWNPVIDSVNDHL